MRRLLFGIGLVLVALVTVALSIAVFSRIVHTAGLQWIALAMYLSSLGAAWAGHTPESRTVAEDVIGAWAEIGMSRKEAAYLMGVPEEQLSRQVNGIEMLSAYRLAQCGPRFREAYHRRQLARETQGVFIANAVLLDILNTVRVLTGQHVVTSVGERSAA